MLPLEMRQRLGPAIDGDHRVTGVFQRARKIGAHGFFVFCKEDSNHDSRPAALWFRPAGGAGLWRPYSAQPVKFVRTLTA
ncbi:hypothetical protein GCM10011371_01150 [Novosphingobium marinum]|nr:hypothetical protein GCM10011371_01150 [Novosphingobium marinum]